ncbi:hypothetical protein [uncultured Mailhella sp.]|uniref:hypothetical protein n=1 Tax=uncultured Mailhella sp. TaxID=1981031 RepID=UPI00320B4425
MLALMGNVGAGRRRCLERRSAQKRESAKSHGASFAQRGGGKAAGGVGIENEGPGRRCSPAKGERRPKTAVVTVAPSAALRQTGGVGGFAVQGASCRRRRMRLADKPFNRPDAVRDKRAPGHECFPAARF